MKKILFNGKELSEYNYSEAKEKDFERDVISNAKQVFGDKTIYIDLKKLLHDKSNHNCTIPDGYLLDYTFATDPRLYFVEFELSVHPVLAHIGYQLSKFALSYQNDITRIKKNITENLVNSDVDIDKIANDAGYRNADDMFNKIIVKEKFGVIVVIDEITEELTNAISIYNFDVALLEFKKYNNADECIYLYDEFNDDNIGKINTTISSEVIPDTVLVAAEEEGFNKAFKENSCWYAISININMKDKIKYLAIYQKDPIKAVTYYAKVINISPYENTGKYILYLEDIVKLKRPIKIDPKRPYKVPRGRVYTNIDKIKNADNQTTVADLY